MTNGPPPSAASSSGSTGPSTTPQNVVSDDKSANLSPMTTPAVSSNSVALGPPQIYANYANWGNSWSSNYSGNYSGYAATPATSRAPGSNSYVNPYTMAYGPHAMAFQSNPYNAYSQFTTKTAPNPPTTKTNRGAGTKPVPPPPRIPTPPLPEPETYKHWDEVMKKFFEATNMVQSLRGLESDIMVLNQDWEQRVLPDALKELVSDLQVVLDRISGKETPLEKTIDMTTKPKTASTDDRTLEERKLEYISLGNGAQPRSQSSINKSISQFLARTRARNDASNRAEFLRTLAEKKANLFTASTLDTNPPTSDAPNQLEEPISCARVDAKSIDRDKQMKYDIAKNEHRPLSRTVSGKQTDGSPSAPSFLLGPNASSTASSLPVSAPSDPSTRPSKKRRLTFDNEYNLAQDMATNKGKWRVPDDPHSTLAVVEEPDGSAATAQRLPGLDERLRSLEDHLAVRYVPSVPRTLLARLTYLEDHLIKLEKEYPPWAALHFNQPNRGWPPPPRATPIIVPPHLRASNPKDTPLAAISTTSVSNGNAPSANAQGTSSKGKGRNKSSSLHKAVLDRLEVQKAMSEMEHGRSDGL